MIYKERPADFNPKFEVVSCVLQHDGKFLLLHRHDHKPQGGTWCLPGGKADADEDLPSAIAREMREETGYDAGPEEFTASHSLLVSHDGYDFIYTVFSHVLPEPLEVRLEESAHKGYRWVTLEQALELPLMPDEDESIRTFYGLPES
ncbi:MAG TPA: NUDIX hydrolase [Candidatus Paceibacterota bacterium]|jgi:8-oxo-dGTP diphosphatase|nr:NUDIX hydrolase [Candidatus Paceibacterota bacterium]